MKGFGTGPLASARDGATPASVGEVLFRRRCGLCVCFRESLRTFAGLAAFALVRRPRGLLRCIIRPKNPREWIPRRPPLAGEDGLPTPPSTLLTNESKTRRALSRGRYQLTRFSQCPADIMATA